MQECFKKIYSRLYTLTYFPSLIPLKVYDILHGTDFAGIGRSGNKDDRFEYMPTPVFSFPSLRRYIQKNMNGGRGHSVLDIGCGKGLVLRFFGSMQFDAVAGIEYEKKLCLQARKNLKSAFCKIKVYHADASDFSMYGDYDTFYLYNPFDKKILEKCADRIVAALELRPRKLTVFYCNPVYADVLKKKGFNETARFYYKTAVFVLDGEKSSDAWE